jgi:alanyl-tRNA synthetase
VDLTELAEAVPATTRIDLADSYARAAQARVLRVVPETRRKGYAILDRSLFHPRGGGQPNDLGTIQAVGATVTVGKVFEQEGVVIHYGELAGPLVEQAPVTLRLDWSRRLLNMRLHTAGHILDHAVMGTLQHSVQSTSASHAPPEGYVQFLSLGPPPPANEVEARANEVVAAARPVTTLQVARADLSQHLFGAPNLARLPALPSYRVVVIEDVNAIPCAGTHVANTQEVGGIRLTKLERTAEGFSVHYAVEEVDGLHNEASYP